MTSSPLAPKAQDLAKAWMLSRSSEQRQLTIRVPSETFFKIQALEAMFTGRSRNEMVSDLLFTALNEFIDGLPEFGVLNDGTRIDLSDPTVPDELAFRRFEGPRSDFWAFYHAAAAKAEGSEKGDDSQKARLALKAVDQPTPVEGEAA